MTNCVLFYILLLDALHDIPEVDMDWVDPWVGSSFLQHAWVGLLRFASMYLKKINSMVTNVIISASLPGVFENR